MIIQILKKIPMIRNLFKKTIDYAITINYIITSTITKKFNKGVHKTLLDKKIQKIYFITPDQQNYIINDGSNLRNTDVLGGPFLRREFNAEIVEISYFELDKIQYDDFSVFATYSAGVTYNWKFFAYFYKVIRLGLKIRRKKMPVIFIIGDSFYPDTAAIGAVLTSLTGGCTLALPNPPNEMKTYGYFNVIWPVIYVEIVHKIRDASTFYQEFSMRSDECLIAAGRSATNIRQTKLDKLKQIMVENGIPTRDSDGTLSENDYIYNLGKIRYYATTNYTQEIYFIGHKKYQKRVSATSLTGRTLNAFAAGMCLIANECGSLRQMGFYKNIHYLDLEEIINTPNYIIPSLDILQEMALKSQARLYSLLDEEISFSSYRQKST